MFESFQPFTATHIAKPLKTKLNPKLVKECVCPHPIMKEENQIKTSSSLTRKKDKVVLINIRGMGATVANIVYKQ